MGRINEIAEQTNSPVIYGGVGLKQYPFCGASAPYAYDLFSPLKLVS
jgi:hypothetical protein